MFLATVGWVALVVIMLYVALTAFFLLATGPFGELRVGIVFALIALALLGLVVRFFPFTVTYTG